MKNALILTTPAGFGAVWAWGPWGLLVLAAPPFLYAAVVVLGMLLSYFSLRAHNSAQTPAERLVHAENLNPLRWGKRSTSL